jgi:hypothetical protein
MCQSPNFWPVLECPRHSANIHAILRLSTPIFEHSYESVDFAFHAELWVSLPTNLQSSSRMPQLMAEFRVNPVIWIPCVKRSKLECAAIQGKLMLWSLNGLPVMTNEIWNCDRTGNCLPSRRWRRQEMRKMHFDEGKATGLSVPELNERIKWKCALK